MTSPVPHIFSPSLLWHVSYSSLSYPVILRTGGGRGKGKGHGSFPIGQVKNFVRIFFYAILQNTLEENSCFLNSSSSLTAACSVFSFQPILYLAYHVLDTLAFFASWPFCAPSYLWAFTTSSPLEHSSQDLYHCWLLPFIRLESPLTLCYPLRFTFKSVVLFSFPHIISHYLKILQLFILYLCVAFFL